MNKYHFTNFQVKGFEVFLALYEAGAIGPMPSLQDISSYPSPDNSSHECINFKYSGGEVTVTLKMADVTTMWVVEKVVYSNIFSGKHEVEIPTLSQIEMIENDALTKIRQTSGMRKLMHILTHRFEA
jgi:hypothetical protein